MKEKRKKKSRPRRRRRIRGRNGEQEEEERRMRTTRMAGYKRRRAKYSNEGHLSASFSLYFRC
jgi:hypothetical protein